MRKKPFRVVFAGTPDFAAGHLNALLQHPLSGSLFHLVGVYTQPDRQAGRGRRVQASPVKSLALAEEIPVFQPLNFKTPEAIAELAALNPDLLIVVAYGLLLPQAVLDTPTLGCINVHASLLPRWRGAAPIQRAIAAGDRETGICIMQMEAGLDTGPVLVRAQLPIGESTTGGELHDQLLSLGCDTLSQSLEAILAGRLPAEQQPAEGVTYAHKLNKTDAIIDWQQPADVIARQIRAFNPFPVAQCKQGDDIVRLWSAHAELTPHTSTPGEIIAADNHALVVACGQGVLNITQLQLPGRKAISIADMLRGHSQRFKIGQSFE